MVRQIPANTVSRAETERLMDVASVVVEGWRGIIYAFGEPAFGNEFFGAVEVAFGVEGGKLVDAYLGLDTEVSVLLLGPGENICYLLRNH